MDGKDSIILRRNNDYQFVERLAQVEEKLRIYQESYSKIQKELDEVQDNIDTTLQKLNSLIEMQQNYKPLLDSFSKVVSAGIVFRWMIIFAIGTLAAIGTMSTAVEVIQKWIR